MSKWSRKQTWVSGLAILVLTNMVILGGVAYNRMGEPDALLVLTERELGLSDSPGFDRENSGISLNIEWRILPAVAAKRYGNNNRWAAAGWLDEARLNTLGFPAGEAVENPKQRALLNRGLPREAWLVLEYDGPAYQAMRRRVKAFSEQQQTIADRNPGNAELEKRAAAARKQWNWEQQSASRLFAVDAGLDAAELRKKYPDRTQYLVMRGQIRAGAGKNAEGLWQVQGYIKGLSVKTVNVPFAWRSVFDSLPGERSRSKAVPPRFGVTLASGRRYEPWVVAAEKLDHQ